MAARPALSVGNNKQKRCEVLTAEELTKSSSGKQHAALKDMNRRGLSFGVNGRRHQPKSRGRREFEDTRKVSGTLARHSVFGDAELSSQAPNKFESGACRANPRAREAVVWAIYEPNIRDCRDDLMHDARDDACTDKSGRKRGERGGDFKI